MKKLFTSIFLIFVVFTPTNSLSQNKKIDSLLNVLKTDREDTNKINNLILLGWELKYNNPDTSVLLGTQAFGLSEKQNWQIGIGKSSNMLGTCNAIKGNYPLSLQHFLKALQIGENFNDKKSIATILGNIATIQQYLGDYSKGLDYYFKALKMDEELGNKTRIARHLSNIGSGYYYKNDHPNALVYYFKALKMWEELGDKSHIAIQLGNIGNIYGEYADAEYLNPDKRAGDSIYKKALKFYFMALKINEEVRNKNGVAANYRNIGAIYITLKKYNEAEGYLLKAFALGNNTGILEIIGDAENSLSELYSKTDRYKMALEHYKNYIAVRDSLSNEENTKKTVQAQMNYEFDKKEQATKLEQDNKNAVAEKEKQKQIILRNSFIGGFALVLILALLILRGYHNKQKANIIISKQKEDVENAKLIIEEQKKKVEVKQKEILDSIHYASRIQRALITPEIYFKNVLDKLYES